ncbi:MAG TPA: hypothetical protein PK788_03405 [Gemmatimonadaceae bacterium]|nr:hypothetical protein [Gemmatimonadaceae bacterium]
MFRVCLGAAIASEAGAQASEREGAVPPALVIGRFVDDYDIRYEVTPTTFRHGSRTRYRIAEWHVRERFFVAQQEPDSTGRAPWVRVDWMEFSGMPPYTWGYCFTVYGATTAAAARTAAPANRETPRTGCGGFPFSRMRRDSTDASAGASPPKARS